MVNVCISCETALRWMSLYLTDKSTLVQVMAWCRQAASHYRSQCWSRPSSPYGVTRPQWVKAWSRHSICDWYGCTIYACSTELHECLPQRSKHIPWVSYSMFWSHESENGGLDLTVSYLPVELFWDPRGTSHSMPTSGWHYWQLQAFNKKLLAECLVMIGWYFSISQSWPSILLKAFGQSF